jgi:hypothetical protein
MENKIEIGITWEYVNSGGEAEVYKATANILEACPKDLEFPEPIVVAKRFIQKDSWVGSEKLWKKNIILKLLDDHFLKQGVYTESHIPKALGYFERGHYYEFVPGSDYWIWKDREDGEVNIYQLDEWEKFLFAFNDAGFGVDHDMCDNCSGSSIEVKNIVHSGGWKSQEDNIKSKYWKRIDISDDSLPWNREITLYFLKKNNLTQIMSLF